MNILIVDDNEINGILLEQMLKVKGYSSLRASSGAEALRILKERMDIRVVIADIMMPEMNGLELLRIIKESYLLKDLPVIMCSSLADIDQVRLAVALGCASYIIKPVNRDLLAQKITQALGNSKPILATEQELMVQHGMDAETYINMVQSFLKLIEVGVESIEATLSSKPNAAPLQLQPILEGATIMGAKQLEARIEDFMGKMGNKHDIKLELVRVLRDMQHVASHLKEQLEKRNLPKTA